MAVTQNYTAGPIPGDNAVARVFLAYMATPAVRQSIALAGVDSVRRSASNKAKLSRFLSVGYPSSPKDAGKWQIVNQGITSKGASRSQKEQGRHGIGMGSVRVQQPPTGRAA